MKRKLGTNNLFMFFILGLFCLLRGFIPPFLWAAPSISSVSGTVSDRQTVTINGSEFGANGPRVSLFEDFENGTDRSNISLTGPQVGAWSKTFNANLAKYTNADKVSGSLSGQFAFDSGVEEVYGGLLIYDATGWDQIFVSGWVKMPSGQPYPTPPQQNWKLWWLDNNGNWGGGSGPNDLVIINGYSFNGGANTFSNSGAISQREWANAYLSSGVWTRYSFWIKQDTSAGNFHAWVTSTANGFHKVWSSDNIKTSNSVADPKWHYFSHNAWANSTNTTTCKPLYDDIYLATGPYARARVEIGNKPTYTNCTNLTILTPTLWSDSSIAATVRQGSFTNGSSAYLFVFDANGAVNTTGYPITIGGPPPPAAPTGLKIIN